MIETVAGIASIVNNGVLRLSSEGKNAVLAIQGWVSLSGAGETFLGNGYAAGDTRSNLNANQIVYGSASAFGSIEPPKLVIEAGHTVRGTGRLGYNGTLAIVNHGTIKADGPGELQVNGLNYFPSQMPFPIVNDGLMRAENGGRMWIQTRVDNTGGVLEALAGSTVEVSDAVKGGTLRSIGTGVVQTRGTNGFATYLTGVTIEGRLTVPEGAHANFGLNGASSTITNNGVIAVGVRAAGAVGNPFGSTLTLYGNTSFVGSGRIEFTDAPSNTFSSYSGFVAAPLATLNAGQTLTGAYELRTAMLNLGRIEVDGSVNGVVIGSGGKLTNQGELVVSSPAAIGLQVSGGQLINEGTLTVNAGSSLLGGIQQNSGTTIMQGSMLDGTFLLKGGVLKGTGDFWGTVNNQGGVFAPGTSPGSTTVVNYTQTAGDLVLEIDGDAVTQRDHLTILGNASFFGGRIVIDLTDYTGSGSVSFSDVLTVGGTLLLKHPVVAGREASIAVVGLRAGASADVAWDGASLGVSVTAPVPEPHTYVLLVAGLGCLGWAARRQRGTGSRASALRST